MTLKAQNEELLAKFNKVLDKYKALAEVSPNAIRTIREMETELKVMVRVAVEGLNKSSDTIDLDAAPLGAEFPESMLPPRTTYIRDSEGRIVGTAYEGQPILIETTQQPEEGK